MIPQRVRQVLAALRAHLSAEDWRFIDAWLQAKAEEAERKRVAASASDQAMKPL